MWPDYIINDIPTSVAMELLGLLMEEPQPPMTRGLRDWLHMLQGEVDMALAQESRTMFPWWREETDQ